jgi:O-antigen ligase
MNMFYDHPVLGVGAGNYENNYQQYAQELGIDLRLEERQSHSLYVQILSETGILGMLAFGGIIFTLMLNLIKARRSINEIDGGKDWNMYIRSIQWAIVSYLVTSLFLHGAYMRNFWVLIALAIASLRISARIVAHPALIASDEAQN